MSTYEDTQVATQGSGTAEPRQTVCLRSGRLDSHGLQLTDLGESESSGELVTYSIRSRDSEPSPPPARLRQIATYSTLQELKALIRSILRTTPHLKN